MGTRQRLVCFGVVLSLVFLAGGGGAAQPHDLVEEISNQGHVNWSAGTMAARGRGAAPEKYWATPQAPAMALKTAQFDAYRNLLEVIRGVRIDSQTTVGQAMTQDETIERQIREMARDAEIVKREYHSDGTVEVTLEMSLYGGFAQLVLPGDVKQLPEIKTIVPAQTSSAENMQDKEALGAVPSETDMTSKGAVIHSGVVLDGRGIDGCPAMSPKIFDEKGEEVYGSAYVSREFAVQYGMAGYERDVETGRSNPRVGDAPLTVKGLRTALTGGSDFVISNSAAAKIRSSSEHLSLLRTCRVLIVLD